MFRKFYGTGQAAVSAAHIFWIYGLSFFKKEDERMHYATLVTVEIEPCEEDMARATEAQNLIRAIEVQKKENPEHHIMLDIYQSEVRMRSTAFSNRMAEEVDAVMEPFYNDTDNPDYLEFEDKTEEYRKAYETETVNLVRFPNGTVLTDDHCDVYCKYEIVDGRLYERDWGPLHHRKRTKKCKRMQVMEHVPYYKVYQTFEEFVEERYGTPYYEEQKAFGYYYNPDAFYDWYSIGGRWPDMFLVKDGCKEYGIADRSWTCADKETKAPEGYHWTCAARKKDIAWQAMYEWELEKAKQNFAKMSGWFAAGEVPDNTCLCIEENGIRRFGELLFRKGETENEYLERYANLKRKKYPLNIYAFLTEGIWTTVERFIPDGRNSRFEDNEDWEDELEQFIDGLDDETVLVSVDCHM